MSTRTRSRTGRRLRLLTAALVLGATALAGCTAGNDDADSGEAGADAARSEPAVSGAEDTSGDEAQSDTASGGHGAQGEQTGAGDGAVVSPAADAVTDPDAPAEQHIARDAAMTLRVDDVDAGVEAVREVAVHVDGILTGEQVRASGEEQYADITLSVPATGLDAALDELADLGTVTRRSVESTNVTQEYVDTASRIETMEAGVERVRALMEQADSMDEVIQLESALNRREADLEALTSRMMALEQDVARSDINLYLTTDADAAAPDDDPRGFVSGLAAGWDAFVTALTTGLAVLGALLPFLGAALVVGLPLLWLLRRQRRRAPATG